MDLTETTSAVEPKWPRWAWFVFPALAITIGGSLGYVVAIRESAEASAAPIAANPPPSQLTVRPIVETPDPVPPAPPPPSETGDPAPAMTLEPEPAAAATAGTVHHVPIRPRQKAKPPKTAPCNVYDHMNGC